MVHGIGTQPVAVEQGQTMELELSDCSKGINVGRLNQEYRL
jgi:hypothetical protein